MPKMGAKLADSFIISAYMANISGQCLQIGLIWCIFKTGCPSPIWFTHALPAFTQLPTLLPVRLPAVNKNHFASLITALFMLFLGACYFFIYMPNNQKNVQEQRFRSLQNIDRSIHAKVDNSIGMMQLLLKAYSTASENTKKYIAGYSREKFALSQPVKLILARQPAIDTTANYSIAESNAGDVYIQYRQTIPVGEDTNTYQMGIRYNADQFIGSMLPAGVFDQYIVFSDGRTVYQSFPAGISYIEMDSVLTAADGVLASTISDVNISGTDYKMFLQPVQLGSREWVVGGLVSKKRFNIEKNQLPAPLILLLVTVALFIILSFPWIKLYQMGSKDRLTLSDAVSTLVVSMLLMSALFFMFFKYNVPFRGGNNNGRAKLADAISKSFRQELDSAYQRITTFDTLVKKLPHQDIAKLGKDSLRFNPDENQNAVYAGIMQQLKNFPVKQVYWLDSTGYEDINWNRDEVNGPHGNFKQRPYFSAIKAKQAYRLKNDPSKIFYLDQVVSKTSGSFTTVMSIPSTYKNEKGAGGYVTGMSFNVKSLQLARLPTGFQYVVIDNTGKVLYHSEIERNLNENLINEFSYSDPLKSSMESRSSNDFKTGYFSNNYYVHVQPIAGLPYFIVMMEDAGFKETRDLEVYSFTLSFMIVFFAFMMFQVVVTFIVSSRKSFFKKQYYNTSWIGPKKSAHRQYNLGIVAHGFMIVLLLIFFQFATFLTYLFILLFAVSFSSLFLNASFAKKYKKRKPENYSYKLHALYWLSGCIVLLDIASFKFLENENIVTLFLFELLSFGVGIPLYLLGDRVLNKVRRTGSKLIRWNYIQSFSLMCITRLVISSGMPVMFCYISAFNYEQQLDARYKQLQFANTIADDFNTTDSLLTADNSPYRAGLFLDGAWVISAKLVPVDSLPDASKYKYPREDEKAIALLNLFRLRINDKSINDDRFYLDKSADKSYYHNYLFQNAISNDKGTQTFVKLKNLPHYLKLSSTDLNYKFPSLFGEQKLYIGLFYWIFFFVVLTLFYLVLQSVIRKIFSLNLPDLARWRLLDEKILQTPSLNNLVFIIGLPGSGKLTTVLEHIRQGAITGKNGKAYHYSPTDDAASDVFVLDLMNIPDSLQVEEQSATWKAHLQQAFLPKNRLVIINHFEYNIQNSATTRIKLNLLEQIMVQNSARVMILSTIHPVAFLDSIFDQSIEPDIENVPGQDLERWHVLLGHFRIVVLPLVQTIVPKMGDRLKEMIARETSATHFLNKMQNAVLEAADKVKGKTSRDRKADELAFKLQMSSHYFYMYIWQSLTNEEKFLLYDHAEDNLVNSFDSYNLNMLVCKGILVPADGSLRIFNNGFRNFILTAIGNVEAVKLKRQIKDNGNWNKLKTPMLIIMLGILAFLVISQQETWSKLITYAAAAATGIPAIMRLLSLFENDKAKSN